MALQFKDGQVVYIEPPTELSEQTQERLRANPRAAKAIERARRLRPLPHRVEDER